LVNQIRLKLMISSTHEIPTAFENCPMVSMLVSIMLNVEKWYVQQIAGFVGSEVSPSICS